MKTICIQKQQLYRVLISLRQKVIVQSLFGIFLWKSNCIFAINHVLKNNLSSVRNCPWCVRVGTYTTECLSKVKEPSSPSVTSANTMPTSDKNSRVVLKVRLICHDEIVYKDIIFCKTSLSVKVNCTFLQKITRLAQNLPKAKINSSIKKRLSLWDFSRFILIKLRQQKWRKCFQK